MEPLHTLFRSAGGWCRRIGTAPWQRIADRLETLRIGIIHFRCDTRAAVRTAVFMLKVLPSLPSTAIDRLTAEPVRETVHYPSHRGAVEAELTRPATKGPHPGIVVCLGVVPFGVDHPQVPRLQDALTRAGFVTLLYWSPHMRDWRLDPCDIDDLAMAFEWLVSRPDVDASRSGLVGTCVGGAFTLLAAASPRIRTRVAFVGLFSPYASIRTLAHDVTSATWQRHGRREPWAVDPLTRKVFVHTLTAHLDASDATLLREAPATPDGQLDPNLLSPAAQAVYPLLRTLPPEDVDEALDRLPAMVRTELEAMSPLTVLNDVAAPLIVLLHDQDDPVNPRTESLRLRDTLADRSGLRYAEFMMFKHLDPSTVHLAVLPLLRELARFYLALYPIFRRASRHRPPWTVAEHATTPTASETMI